MDNVTSPFNSARSRCKEQYLERLRSQVYAIGNVMVGSLVLVAIFLIEYTKSYQVLISLYGEWSVIPLLTLLGVGGLMTLSGGAVAWKIRRWRPLPEVEESSSELEALNDSDFSDWVIGEYLDTIRVNDMTLLARAKVLRIGFIGMTVVMVDMLVLAALLGTSYF